MAIKTHSKVYIATRNYPSENLDNSFVVKQKLKFRCFGAKINHICFVMAISKTIHVTPARWAAMDYINKNIYKFYDLWCNFIYSKFDRKQHSHHTENANIFHDYVNGVDALFDSMIIYHLVRCFFNLVKKNLPFFKRNPNMAIHWNQWCKRIVETIKNALLLLTLQRQYPQVRKYQLKFIIKCSTMT